MLNVGLEAREMPSILSHCSKWIGRFPWFGPDPCQNLQLGRDHRSSAGLNDILATSTSPAPSAGVTFNT